MRLLVSGDRKWGLREDPELSLREADWLTAILNGVRTSGEDPIEVLIHGGATGADMAAGLWAEAHGIPVLVFMAEWYGPHGNFQRWAGPVRNQRMLTEGKPDVLVAFHPNITESRGTKDMVKKALKAGLPVYLCDSDGNITTGAVL